jgi:hypothetical protein
MSRTYKGSNNDVILEAVRSCDLLDGATHTWLIEKTGISHGNMTKSLCYLANEVKLIYSWKHGKWIRYFATQEAREAAMPALEAFKEKLREIKLARAREHYARLKPEQLKKIHERRRLNHLKKMAARPPKVVKEKPAKVKAKAAKLPKPAKPVKPAADAPVRVARPVAGGPARMPGEPVITSDTRITIAPPPPERVYRTSTYAVMP